jgi:hypothetical protein
VQPGPRLLDDPRIGLAVRTPRAAGVAGIVFSVLLLTAIVLIRVAVPADPRDAGAWLSNPRLRGTVLAALQLVPFASIAFLWFIGVVRDRLGVHEDRFFASVFLGSGLLFVAMMLASAGIADSLISGVSAPPSTGQATDTWKLGSSLVHTLFAVYTMRMAAVFTISTATIMLRPGLIPRWIGLSGYVVGAVLLLVTGYFPWVELLFPLWVFLVSAHILLVSLRPGSEPIANTPTRSR